MRIEFDKEYLKDLYYDGKTEEKKYRFQPQVIAKYVKVVNILESVSRIEDLFRYKSLNYEALSGDLNGLDSVRVDRRYRLEFCRRYEGDKVSVTICRLMELSNHYR